MDKKQKILETLQMQPLSDEEKSSRHILGRLYGPIATSLESTRNGRKYNADLWNKALNDDIFKEKIANKSLFLELGHPADREETDMEKVCACIPEMPKIVDGELYAYVDILDTNNGRLLKTLCDYGFVPGISSRGSGDIMANDEVDPETFFLETWDIVQLPAVKKARLSMCESYNGKTLKKALTESYEAASDEDKKEMKEILENLEFDMDFPEIKEAAGDMDLKAYLIDPANIETGVEDVEAILMEEAEDEISAEENIEEVEDEVEEPVEDIENEEVVVKLTSDEVATVVQETAAEVADMVQEVVEPTEKQEEEIAEKVDEIVVNKVEEVCPDCEAVVEKEDSDEDVEETDSKDIKEEQPEAVEADGEDKEAESVEESEVKEEEPAEEVADSEMDEMLENLKELIRQKGLLESEVKTLKSEKAVSDAEVKNLKEELNKYKTGFARVSELAAKSTKFEKEVQGLTEQLTQKESEITDLRSKIVNTTKLTESVNAHETQVKSLTEKLDAMQKDLTDSETKLTEQRAQYKAKLTEAVDVAKTYKTKFESVINHYIESKASMLGVRPSDIIRKLNENYTLEDVDAVCDELLEAPSHFSNALFEGFNNGAKVKFTEAKTAKVEADEDDLSDLLELAGLKK